MSFHKKHRRVPCKFSPKLLGQVCSELASPALKDETVKKEKKTALEVMSRQLIMETLLCHRVKSVFCWYFIDSTQALYEAGVKIKGTDVPTWIAIMSERSVPHLQMVFERYKNYSPYMQEIPLLIHYTPADLCSAAQSKGAKEKSVTRIIVSRCESLQKTILEHTKGDYQKVLLGLCGPEE
uniref:Annexin A2 n=1 Tax=Gasterosteus aculeatus aculeatus TaxID=481459 RepID=A0AAQ4R767_GASAC